MPTVTGQPVPFVWAWARCMNPRSTCWSNWLWLQMVLGYLAWWKSHWRSLFSQDTWGIYTREVFFVREVPLAARRTCLAWHISASTCCSWAQRCAQGGVERLSWSMGLGFVSSYVAVKCCESFFHWYSGLSRGNIFHIQKIFAYHVFIVLQTWVLVCYFDRPFQLNLEGTVGPRRIHWMPLHSFLSPMSFQSSCGRWMNWRLLW